MSPALTKAVLGVEDDDDTPMREAERRARQAERQAGIDLRAAALAHEGRNLLQQTLISLEILASKLTSRPSQLIESILPRKSIASGNAMIRLPKAPGGPGLSAAAGFPTSEGGNHVSFDALGAVP